MSDFITIFHKKVDVLQRFGTLSVIACVIQSDMNEGQ